MQVIVLAGQNFNRNVIVVLGMHVTYTLIIGSIDKGGQTVGCGIAPRITLIILS